jgi:hypothetical protein
MVRLTRSQTGVSFGVLRRVNNGCGWGYGLDLQEIEGHGYDVGIVSTICKRFFVTHQTSGRPGWHPRRASYA